MTTPDVIGLFISIAVLVLFVSVFAFRLGYHAAIRAHQGEGKESKALAGFSRYGDHDRACPAREDSLRACTCGFVQMVNELAHQGEGT